MKVVGRDIGDITTKFDQAAIVDLASASSFQLTYNDLRDDNDRLIATYSQLSGWTTPDGQQFSDITFEED